MCASSVVHNLTQAMALKRKGVKVQMKRDRRKKRRT